jgi:hypothetical protein
MAFVNPHSLIIIDHISMEKILRPQVRRIQDNARATLLLILKDSCEVYIVRTVLIVTMSVDIHQQCYYASRCFSYSPSQSHHS